MNITKDTSTITGQTLTGLMSERQYIFVMVSCAVVWTSLSVIGVISNVINIRTFIAIGLKDGVTVSFLALSIFDLAYVLVSLSMGIFVALYMLEVNLSIVFPVQFFGISIIFANLLILINVWNVLTTTFLAVARCMCIARPLQFKNAFTRQRTLIILAVFFLFPVALYTPVLSYMGMVTRFDGSVNMTRPVLWISPSRENIKVTMWVITDLVLPVSTQLIVMACVVVMANCLRASIRFRQVSTVTDVIIKSGQDGRKALKKTHDDDNKTDHTEKDICGKISSDSLSGEDGVLSGKDAPSNKLSGKDLKVVQQVVLICAVYIVCNLPKILISLTSVIDSEFSFGHRYHNFYLSCNALRKHFEIVNSSVNLLIYYKYNTKFRTLCRLLGYNRDPQI